MSDTSRDGLFPGARGIQVTAPDSTSTVSGRDGKLFYGDHPIEKLADLPYEVILYYLKNKNFPSLETFEVYLNQLKTKSAQDAIDPLVFSIINNWDPNTKTPMEILQSVSAVSGLKFDDPEKAFVQFPLIVGLINQRLEGANTVTLPDFPNDRPYSIPEHLVRTLKPNVTDTDSITAWSDTMRLFCIVHLTHGIGNASTFTAKVAAGTMASLAAVLSSATGALSGALHGGANEAALGNLSELLIFVNQDKKMILDTGELAGELAEGITQEELDAKVSDFISAKQGKGEKIPGLGHAEYKVPDPRAALIRERLEAIGHKSPFYTLAASLERAAGNNKKFQDKGIYPNVDFYTGILLQEVLQLKTEIMTPLFAASRSAGWLFGGSAQFGKLIRPGEDQGQLAILQSISHNCCLPSFTEDYRTLGGPSRAR